MNIELRLEHLAKQVPFLRRPFHQRDSARTERDALALRLASYTPSLTPRHIMQAHPDLRADLRSLAEWQSFVAAHPHIRTPAEPDRIVAHCQAHGLYSDYLGYIPPVNVAVRGPNLREQFLAAGFNPRQRALLDLLAETVAGRSIYDLSIYAHEGLTPLALALRGRYPRFLGSEYAPTESEQNRIYPIPSIDITNSGLPENSFDIVVSGDVLEHVPDLAAALADTARILAPGGKLIASVPFAPFHAETTVKARLTEGAIRHLSPPEYHGNPMDPAQGSLVFQIPGWDILSQARDAGFTDANMLFWSSTLRGLTAGPDLAGILLFVATK
jgi:SAM-dependent methyltransferase